MRITGNQYFRTILGAILIAVCFGFFGTVLQRTSTDLFHSPDETAVMIFARAWTPGGGFHIPHRLPTDLASLASLHPRSMVRQGDMLVPVGFLGMPIIIAIAERMIHGLGTYFTLLLVLSSAIPLWLLVSRISKRTAWTSVLIYVSFPTVMLYANRGLFPNLPVVAFTMWSIWAFSVHGIHVKQRWHAWLIRVIAGATLGFALLIRPTEAIWIIPWVAWGVWLCTQGGVKLKAFVLSVIVAGMILCGGYAISQQTYDFANGWMPKIGYTLRDNAGVSREQALEQIDAPMIQNVRLPFGFHPRVMWENIQLYLFEYLGIWIAAALVGTAMYLRRTSFRREQCILLTLTAWTGGVLLLMYGQSLYGDNIRGSITLANSFLRYLLPLVPLLAIGIALLMDWIWILKKRGKMLGILATGFFIILGVLTAFARDEEGILAAQYELRRYVSIRATTDDLLPDDSIIISERSDKLFASGPYVVVSPLPNDETLNALRETPGGIYFFHRLMSEQEVAERMETSVLLFQEGNEGMYQIKPIEIHIP